MVTKDKSLTDVNVRASSQSDTPRVTYHQGGVLTTSFNASHLSFPQRSRQLMFS